MICCFPFTYLSDTLIDPLTETLGPLMLLQPLEKPVPLHMQKRVDGGILQLFSPADIDGARIEQAIQAFTSWAALHGGKPGDLKRFFQASQGAEQWLQGPPTNEIRAQLRHELRGKTAPQQVDTLFQAAFFLALAHRYDQQQDDVVVDIGSVHSLETRFGEILDGPGDRKTSLGPDLTTSFPNGAADPGMFMTAQRLEAWARMAATCEISANLFATTSRAVWELLNDRFSEMGITQTVKLGLGGKGGENQESAQEAWSDALAALARSDDPGAVALDHLDAGEDAWASLTVLSLAGVTPPEMMARLIDEPTSARGVEKAGQVRNTLIGHVAVSPMPA